MYRVMNDHKMGHFEGLESPENGSFMAIFGVALYVCM